jgi:hypothetical protein
LRIIFLNSWFGKAGKPFFDFIKSQSSKTDIFCLMEVSPEMNLRLLSILKKHYGLYEEGIYVKSFGVSCGQAIFVKRKFERGISGKKLIYHQTPRNLGFMQFAEVGIKKKTIWLGSIHGKTLPGDKLDTPVRLKQSRIIINFFSDKVTPRIIGGDFNLMPDTKSIAIFEKAGYRNLIKEYGIKETRGTLNRELYKEKDIQHFADYVFTSKDIKIKKFEVPDIEVSDHLPQILDFEV